MFFVLRFVILKYWSLLIVQKYWNWNWIGFLTILGTENILGRQTENWTEVICWTETENISHM